MPVHTPLFRLIELTWHLLIISTPYDLATFSKHLAK